MCAPMYLKSEEIMYEGVVEYAREYKRFEGKSPEQIDQEIEEFKKTPMNTLKALQNLIAEVRDNVDMTYSPTFVVDRKSTRLNSSHVKISYAVFCLKKKKKK